VSTDDAQLAEQFLDALREAALTGSLEPVFPYVAEDVEWMPRALSGIDELREHPTLGRPPEELELEFELGELKDLGDGRFEVDVRQLYRMKSTGDVASTRDRRIELVVRDGKVARYDMQVVG
jgi:hypothetical protein